MFLLARANFGVPTFDSAAVDLAEVYVLSLFSSFSELISGRRSLITVEETRKCSMEPITSNFIS